MPEPVSIKIKPYFNLEELEYSKRVGGGSFGEVYKGTLHGTDVAIKVFLDECLSDKACREFKHEVNLMSHLRHPNIVLFMGAVIQPTQLAIVSEFVPRGSFFKLLHCTHAHIHPRRLLLMALDIARGMNYLHSIGPKVVHRDLKSPNLLVDMDWTIKIADFGMSFANALTSSTPKSSTGTPHWMAPEVLRSERATAASDVFSYGVILWECVTRQVPWEGLDVVQILSAVGLRQKRLNIPHDLDPKLAQLIRACFEEEPQMRPDFKTILEKLNSMEVLLPSPSCMAAREAEVQS
uniref:non-specific serine/threonine protein kinase n=1 Tax=Dunaliella salina TaxID=3046 RepID=U5Q957_DUNSA|nr:mitogen-activated protein kinase kinase kinase [Dunaliella salina]